MGIRTRVAICAAVLLGCSASHGDGDGAATDASAGSVDAGAGMPELWRIEGVEPPFVEIYAAGAASCALTRAGRAVCWGQVGGTFGFGQGCRFGDDGVLACWRFGGEPASFERFWPPTQPLHSIGMNAWGLVYGLGEAGEVVFTDGVSQPSQALTGTYQGFAVGGDVFYLLRHDGTAIELLSPHIAAPPADRVYRRLVAGRLYGCGLADDGTVDCFGSSGFSSSHRIASPEGEFIDVAAADGTHACGLRPDGSAECWKGEEVDAELAPATCVAEACDVLAGRPGTFTQLAVGYRHNCGLRPEGEVECWGLGARDDDCLAEDATAGSWQCGQARPPAGPFVRIAAGLYHTCGLRPAGSIACWGAGTARGECPLDVPAPGARGQCGQSLPP